MKQAFSILLAAALLLAGFALGEATGDFEVVFSERFAFIVGYSGDAEDLVIPGSFVWDYAESISFPLNAIDSRAFAGNETLRSVVVPEGVEHIFDGAFANCAALERVVLPRSLTTIGSEAFAGCAALREIVLPDHLHELGADVFRDCDLLVLSPAQQAVLDNNEQALQEAFVVDPGALVALDTLAAELGYDFYAFTDAVPGMQNDYAGDGLQYSSPDVSVVAEYGGLTVDYISIDRKANYSLAGVYVSMDGEAADAVLVESGWELREWNGDSASYACGRALLDFRMDKGGAITGIGYWTPEKAPIGTHITATGDLNLREGPSLEADVLCVIPAGAEPEFAGGSEEDARGVVWYCVRYAGETGWASSRYLDVQ